MRNNILATTTRIDILPDREFNKRKTQKMVFSQKKEDKKQIHNIGGSDFQSLLQSVYDGAIITDTSGNIVDVNDRVCQFLKCNKSEIMETNVVSIIYGSDISLIKNLRNSLKSNKYILIQAACMRSDEQMFPAEISVNQITLANITYFCFFVRDITVRRQAEIRFKTGNTAIQNAATGIATANLVGVVEYTNHALLNLWGIDNEDVLVGQNIRNFLCDDDTAENIEKAISRGMLWTNELVCETLNGSRFYVQVSIAPNLDSENQITGMVLSLLDTTEIYQTTQNLEKTMKELQRSNEDLEQFAYAVSHDLQAPLRKISTFADIIKSKGTDQLPETVTNSLGRMQNAALRMSDLIQGLLQYSRVSSKEKAHKPLDLNHIIQDVLSDLEVPLKESGGVVTVNPMPEVVAEPIQMRQLFQNLIGNALKFHKPDNAPIIEISARNLTPSEKNNVTCCEIVVKDNGIGFPEKDAARIFGVFQRLHKQSEYEGTGIGLAICKKIAERHNGQLTAESSEGNGASFKIELPLN